MSSKNTDLVSDYSPLQEMRLLADNQIHDNRIANLNGKDADNQAKLFLVAQARNELQRILKMTEFLDNLENKFMHAVNKKLIEQPNNLNLIMTAMNITQESLKRSNELVSKVLNDDSLQTLVVNTVNIIPGVDDSSVINMTSRENIRAVASNLLAQLQSNSTNDDNNVIDIDTTNNEDGDNIEKSK